MRPGARLLATPLSSTLLTSAPRATPPAPTPGSSDSTITPPLPLYRRLLRLHRLKLHPEERIFGDTYVKAEFRRHQSVDNPLHVVGFLSKWQEYGNMLEYGQSASKENGVVVEGEEAQKRQQATGQGQGLDIDREKLDKLSDQQIGQLYELRQAIKNRRKGGE